MTDESTNPKASQEESTPVSSGRNAYRIDAPIVVIVIVTILAAFVFSKISEPVEVQVTCNNISGGFACTLTSDTKNSAMLNACWSINRVCENGVKSSARKCQSIYFQPGKDSVSVLANSEFENDNECKKVSAFSVEDISLASPESRPANTLKP